MTLDLVPDGAASVAQRFGAVLRARREDAGYSQEELAERAGLHRTYVSLIERGQRNATLGVLEQLARALDVRMAELVDELERP